MAYFYDKIKGLTSSQKQINITFQDDSAPEISLDAGGESPKLLGKIITSLGEESQTINTELTVNNVFIVKGRDSSTNSELDILTVSSEKTGIAGVVEVSDLEVTGSVKVGGSIDAQESVIAKELKTDKIIIGGEGNIGDETTPIYWKDGVAKPCSLGLALSSQTYNKSFGPISAAVAPTKESSTWTDLSDFQVTTLEGVINKRKKVIIGQGEISHEAPTSSVLRLSLPSTWNVQSAIIQRKNNNWGGTGGIPSQHYYDPHNLYLSQDDANFSMCFNFVAFEDLLSVNLNFINKSSEQLRHTAAGSWGAAQTNSIVTNRGSSIDFTYNDNDKHNTRMTHNVEKIGWILQVRACNGDQTALEYLNNGIPVRKMEFNPDSGLGRSIVQARCYMFSDYEKITSDEWNQQSDKTQFFYLYRNADGEISFNQISSTENFSFDDYEVFKKQLYDEVSIEKQGTTYDKEYFLSLRKAGLLYKLNDNRYVLVGSTEEYSADITYYTKHKVQVAVNTDTFVLGRKYGIIECVDYIEFDTQDMTVYLDADDKGKTIYDVSDDWCWNWAINRTKTKVKLTFGVKIAGFNGDCSTRIDFGNGVRCFNAIVTERGEKVSYSGFPGNNQLVLKTIKIS